MRKLSLLAVLVCMALTLTACANTDIGQYYQSAQLHLGCGDYEYAADLFEQLGEYEDAADYALYCRALLAMQEEDYTLARANLVAVNPFKSSGRYLMYLDALQAENANDLETALALYEKLGTFADAHLAAERLRTAIPEAAMEQGHELMANGDYEAARRVFLGLDGYGNSQALAQDCADALTREAYQAAEELAQSGDMLGAMSAFTALGDSLDAVNRAEACRAAIRADLDKRYAGVTLATAPALIEAYQTLGEDVAAKARITALQKRYGKNFELTAMEQPFLQLGTYPYAESGEEKPVLWRAIKRDGAMVTLLSVQVLDASAEAQTVSLTFSKKEQSAVSEVLLPAMADLTALDDRSCTATPYAMAQGASGKDGASPYWLRDSLENGLHPVIGADGAMTLSEADQAVGVRPMIVVDLEKVTFTAGSGTAEDPFCIK